MSCHLDAHRTAATEHPHDGERGSALVVALILVILLTVIGFGLITRSLLVTRIAGSERWSTKAFYAADSGLEVAKARLRVRRTQAFQFPLDDLRGPQADRLTGTIAVSVTDMTNVGAPQLALGSQAPGGQGGAEPLYFIFYKGMSTADETLTRSERQIEATMGIGPVPLSIPQ